MGLGRKGTVVGWIQAKAALAWSQGLTLTFKKPTTHDRVMLFKDKTSIQALVEGYDLARYQQLYQSASQGKRGKDSPVVAIQPAADIDIRKNFYLLPIHDYEEIYLKDATARLLQVSSIPFQKKVDNTAQTAGGGQATPGAYTAGIVFAIDATLSMQPYIDRTRQAVQKIYASLQQAELSGQVHFGLVAFRDNMAAVPGIDYLTRNYVTLDQGRDAGTFMRGINAVQAAQVSTRQFIEDSYAGAYTALNETNWSPHNARYIVLITDAGPRDADDPLSSTGLDAARLNQLARDNDVAIFVMHLLTPDPMANHQAAAERYRKLSEYPDIGSLYYAVPTGDVRECGNVIESLSSQITRQVASIKGNVEKADTSQPAINPQQAALQAKVAKLGHALRLRYLQSNQNELDPDVFKAWLLDKDFRNPEKTALDVRVLISRDQLSDLHSILQQVLETAEQGLVSPQDFLNDLKSLAATIRRDPQQLGGTTAATAGEGNSLTDMGFMREYIEDLPYAGEIMNLDLNDWQRWTAKQQVGFLHGLEEKISYYLALHDHTDLWISLDGGSIDGDAVFPIPLKMLP